MSRRTAGHERIEAACIWNCVTYTTAVVDEVLKAIRSSRQLALDTIGKVVFKEVSEQVGEVRSAPLSIPR